MKRLTFNAAMEQFYREFPRTVPEDEEPVESLFGDTDGPMPWDEMPEDMG